MKFFYRRRFIFLTFVLCVTGTLFYMSHTLNSINSVEADLDSDRDEIISLKSKIKSLEEKAIVNEKNLRDLEGIFRSLKNGSKNEKIIDSMSKKADPKPSKFYEKQCDWFGLMKPKNSDFQASELIETLPFDDVDGGVWKQGFELTFNPNQWNRDNKLNVIIVPHSHNDPGWIMTYEEYFEQRTRNILNTIVNALTDKPNRKFIWAEMSYLSLWWNQASDDMKKKMKHLIVDTKQLEIVTGGWVMNDEANSHYYAMIEQMIEGHEWLKNNIDSSIRPTYGWSIDPFGYSPTMAYLLSQMGFDSMLIQRVHYHLKKYLAQNQRFEFMWKQSWSTSKDNSIFCHVMPFYSYDIPHTCGPDPKICCQFDFARASGHFSCPWGIQPQLINARNVDERAKTLLDQYRKKSQLYGDKNNHNVLLVVLGDDFRYQTLDEANLQFDNYEKLIDYINSKPELNANIKFGTLKDYFELVLEKDKQMNINLPSFSGDFFTYADRQDHYWSGYFTSRAFYKRLDRLVEGYLRSAEIFFSFNNLLGNGDNNKMNQLYKELLVARRNLGLFQHHDGITGTSKSFVVLDYANKLYLALQNAKNIIENSASQLMTENETKENIFNIDDVRLSNTREASQKIDTFINLSNNEPEHKIILLNSNLNKRTEIVSLRVNNPNVYILTPDGKVIKNIQLNLVWPNTDGGHLNDRSSDRLPSQGDLSFTTDFNRSLYELLFLVELDPLSMTTFTLRKKSDSEPAVDNFPKVTFYSKNMNNLQAQQEALKSLNVKIELKQTSDETIKIHTGLNSEAYFSSNTGLLQKIVTSLNERKTRIKLVKYGTTSSREKSGAYLFLPDGPAVEIDSNLFQWIRVEHDGLLRNRVCVNMTLILHCVEFYPELNDLKKFKTPYFSLWNVVDLRQSHNYEMAFEVETDIKNKEEIYTDLNGFQFAKHKRYDKLTIQGNVYPMPSGAFIQDSKTRLNVISAQPLGVGTLNPGCIQVILDRRLDQDDNRGMEQAMNDNVIVSNRFIILYEDLNRPSDHPSIVLNLMSHDLLNPVIKLISLSKTIKSKRNFVKKNLPCDLRLVNLRTMQNEKEEPLKNDVGLILHRVPYDDCSSGNTVELVESYRNECASSLNSKFEDLFLSFKDFNVKQTYLTLQYKESISELIRNDDFIFKYLEPMQIEAFRVII